MVDYMIPILHKEDKLERLSNLDKATLLVGDSIRFEI